MSDQNRSKDTGRDCPYCGGVIYHVENEAGPVKTTFHNCKICGARWSNDWLLTTPGNRTTINSTSPAPQRKKATPATSSFDWQSITIPKWGWVIIVLLGAFVLIRLGILSLLSTLMIPLMFIILGYVVFKIGKEQQWW